jgi:tRNA nucleotidyltransferase (CCA-adding enzyme)
MAKTGDEEVKRLISIYFTQLRNVRCLINGYDLKTMEVPPGPWYKEILDRVLKARLDNEVVSREDELALARKTFRRMAKEAANG